MNNANGKRLVSQVREGDLVTIRCSNGALATGRAYVSPDGLYIRDAVGFVRAVTPETITEVQPGLRL